EYASCTVLHHVHRRRLPCLLVVGRATIGYGIGAGNSAGLTAHFRRRCLERGELITADWSTKHQARQKQRAVPDCRVARQLSQHRSLCATAPAPDGQAASCTTPPRSEEH